MSAHTPPDDSGRARATTYDEMKDRAFVPTNPVDSSADRVITRLRVELDELRAEVCRLRPALEQSQTAREDVARLRQAVESHTERLDALAAKLEAVRAGRDEVVAAVARLDDHLPRVEDELRDALYDLQDSLSGRDPAPGTEVAYRQVVRAIRAAVRANLPRQAKVLVVGKADKELLSLYGREASCFPQGPDGRYAGYYPACDTAAIAHLEALRAAGAEYLLIPEPWRWWLDYYAGLSRHLARRYRLVLDQPDACVIYELRGSAEAGGAWHRFDEVFETFRSRYGRDPAILDWGTGLGLSARLPDAAVFVPAELDDVLPYLDGSVDIVAVASPDTAHAAEAARVANVAVVTLSADRTAERGTPSLNVLWKVEADAVDLPTASIVIPCFNGIAHTEACLSALRETLPVGFTGEIIVVDDASSDRTQERMKRWAESTPSLKLIRNSQNEGFVASCNTGAKAATGDVLVFLNNDTIPLPGWLPALLRVFRDRPEAGAVGGKLIYPDGTLQEAGGLVFRDGSAANFGRDDVDPDGPLYGFVREVDYCSAALLATRRALFEDAGGFDTRYEPGYYEDTDYCFTVRERGFRVYFQPDCAAVHVEGGTAGTDVSEGMKRFQVVNQAKFVERWARTLRRQPARPAHLDFAALHALAGRGRVDTEDADER